MTLFQTALSKAAAEYGLDLSGKQLHDFDLYYQMLIEYNKRVNLTAITAPDEVAAKHIIDSLACCQSDIFRPGSSVLDVGTGAGFPGLALKIFRPDLELTLMDSLKKRLTFLEDLTAALNIETKIVHSRAETAGQDKNHREKYQIVVARAVAKLAVLSEYCLPFAALGGWFAALKGAACEQELAEAHNAITTLGGVVEKVIKITLPGLPDKRAVIFIKKTTPTPRAYPRREGAPEKKPL